MFPPFVTPSRDPHDKKRPNNNFVNIKEVLHGLRNNQSFAMSLKEEIWSLKKQLVEYEAETRSLTSPTILKRSCVEGDEALGQHKDN